MTVQPAPFPALGFDCVTAMTPERAAGLYGAGMRFAVRYLGSLTQAERDVISSAGLSLMPVGYSRAPGWTPTPGMGRSDGMQDLVHLHEAGIPDGVTVWIDLEGVAGTSEVVAQWVNERAAVLQSASYSVGLYVGAGQPLSAGELYALPQVTHYWRSLSSGVPEPQCGWSLIQLYPSITVAGTEIDVDVTQFDNRGRRPTVLCA